MEVLPFLLMATLRSGGEYFLVQTGSPQESSRTSSGKIHTEVRVFIEEEFEEERDHEEYAQPYPVEHSVQVQGPPGISTSRVSYFTRCRFRPEEREPSAPPVPLPSFSMGALIASRNVDVPLRLIPAPQGNTRTDPIITKSVDSPGGSGDAEDSDRPILYGPDVDFLLARDVRGWEFAGWLPESTSLHLYGRALFGQFQVFDLQSDLQMYSAGLRLAVPFLDLQPFTLSATVSSGPGYMRTDIGDAVGLEAGAGLQGGLFLSRRVCLMAMADVNVFLSGDFFSWGPGINVGLNVAW